MKKICALIIALSLFTAIGLTACGGKGDDMTTTTLMSDNAGVDDGADTTTSVTDTSASDDNSESTTLISTSPTSNDTTLAD